MIQNNILKGESTMPEKEESPLYLSTSRTDRLEKIACLKEILMRCSFCPRRCRVNRLTGVKGECGAPENAVIEGAAPHYGEERILVGRGGSGTIFFVHCNMNCVFCQNWTISRGVEGGKPVTEEHLSEIMLGLQEQGCHNINLVSPTPYLYQVAAALNLAIDKGLRLPVIYNSSGYESPQVLRLLDGFIDIYMPDAKYSSDLAGERYSGVAGYYSSLKAALKEMQEQVGDLKISQETGLAYRGLLVRHLVMPEGIAGTGKLMRFLKEKISPRCAVNVMSQYYPAYRAGEFPELKRRASRDECREAIAEVEKAGLRLVN